MAGTGPAWNNCRKVDLLNKKLKVVAVLEVVENAVHIKELCNFLSHWQRLSVPQWLPRYTGFPNIFGGEYSGTTVAGFSQARSLPVTENWTDIKIFVSDLAGFPLTLCALQINLIICFINQAYINHRFLQPMNWKGITRFLQPMKWREWNSVN